MKSKSYSFAKLLRRPLLILAAVSVVLVALAVTWSHFSLTPEGARKKLAEQNIEFNADQFFFSMTNPDVVELFLRAGISPRIHGQLGSPFHYLSYAAARADQEDQEETENILNSAKLLVKYKADINSQDDNHETPISRHIIVGGFDFGQGKKGVNAKYLDFLVENDANLNMRYAGGQTVLMRAAQLHEFEAMKVLLEQKETDVKAVDSAGKNALIHLLIARLQKPEQIKNDQAAVEKMVVTLLEKGIGLPPLTAATKYPGVTKLLIDKGANVNEQGEDGTTAFIEAAMEGEVETAKILLWAGADKNAISDPSSGGISLAGTEIIYPGGTALDNMLTRWSMLSVVIDGSIDMGRKLAILQDNDKTDLEKQAALDKHNKEFAIMYRERNGKYLSMLKFLVENNVGSVRKETEETILSIAKSMPPSILPEYIEILRSGASR